MAPGWLAAIAASQSEALLENECWLIVILTETG